MMRKVIEDTFVEQVRELLIVSDALGYFETSLHLNAALVTLDGKGLAPAAQKRARRVA
jgi:hypothetical protein